MNRLSEEQTQKYLIQAYDVQNQELNFSKISRCQDWPYALKSRDWTKIKSLNFLMCQVDDENISEFTSFEWPQLEKLELAKNYKKLTAPGIKKLIKQGNSFSKLTYLGLWYAEIGSIGVKHLIKINMPNIQNLRMGHCYITNEGMKHIVKGRWSQITQLQLCYNRIHSCNVHYLSEADWNAVELSLSFNDIGFSCLLTFAIMKSSKIIERGGRYYFEGQSQYLRDELKKIQKTRNV